MGVKKKLLGKKYWKERATVVADIPYAVYVLYRYPSTSSSRSSYKVGTVVMDAILQKGEQVQSGQALCPILLN